MRVIQGNLLEMCKSGDAVCCTTNGVVKFNEKLAMGAGVAKLFRDTFKGVDTELGRLVKYKGNNCYYVGEYMYLDKAVAVISFPTKYNWKHDSSLRLIEESCKQLLSIVQSSDILKGDIYLPMPGCCHGNLSKEDVLPLIEKYFIDDRYIICHL